MDMHPVALSLSLSPRKWMTIYAARLFELSAGKIEPPMPDSELRSFALACARGAYPAFRSDDPVECADAEFLEWRKNTL